MEEYKSNSFKSKEMKPVTAELPKFEKAISGSVKTHKKNAVDKMAELFLPEDVSDIGSYMTKCAKDTFIPMIKNSVVSFVSSALGVDTGRFINSVTGSSPRVGYINYNAVSNKQTTQTRQSNLPKSMRDFDELIFDNQGAAKIVLEQMCDIIQEYGFVTVAAFYDLCGYYGENTTNKYGWNDLSTARIVQVGGGFVIRLPRAIPRE